MSNEDLARRLRASDSEKRGSGEAGKEALSLISGCKTRILSRLEDWKRLKRRGLSGVLIAVSRVECGGWRFGDRSLRKIVKYLRLEKWKRLKTQRLFGFLIPDLRLEIVLDGGGTRSGALPRVPVALSYKVTTHVNTMVTDYPVRKYPDLSRRAHAGCEI